MFFSNFDYAAFGQACQNINYWAFWCGVVLMTAGIMVTLSNGAPEPEKKFMSVIGFIPMVALMIYWYPPAGQGPGIVETMWEICYKGDGGNYSAAGNGGGQSLTELVGAPSQFSSSALVIGDTSSIEGKMVTVLGIETLLMVARDQQQTGDSTRSWTDSLSHVAGLGGLGFVYLGYLLYNISLMVAGAVGPFFFGLMAFPQTRHIGFGFLLSTISTALWPVGWALCSFVTDFLLNEAISALGTTAVLSTLASAITSAGTGTPLDSLIGNVVNTTSAVQWSAIAGAWMVASTFAVPAFLQYLFSYGVGSFGQSLGQGVQGTTMGQTLQGHLPTSGASLSSTGGQSSGMSARPLPGGGVQAGPTGG